MFCILAAWAKDPCHGRKSLDNCQSQRRDIIFAFRNLDQADDPENKVYQTTKPAGYQRPDGPRNVEIERGWAMKFHVSFLVFLHHPQDQRPENVSERQDQSCQTGKLQIQSPILLRSRWCGVVRFHKCVYSNKNAKVKEICSSDVSADLIRESPPSIRKSPQSDASFHRMNAKRISFAISAESHESIGTDRGLFLCHFTACCDNATSLYGAIERRKIHQRSVF